STKLLPAWRAITAELKLPNRLLLHNICIRWNSTYDMLNKSPLHGACCSARCCHLNPSVSCP
ncbi:hypothetical protein LXA43DRAFT_893068, partial [Ganoderma leucocontextum]